MTSSPTTVAVVTTTMPPPTTTTPSTTITLGLGDVEGFEVAEITLANRAMTVAVADTPELRQRGLMFVEDLGDLEGMLFVFEEERGGGFWMKNTLIPLDIAYFDTTGLLVGVLSMTPCEADPCPTYDVGMPYQYALETPAGVLVDIPADSVLSIDG